MEQKKAHIREKHPWFWTLKGIFLERPNLVPTGIGNNESGYDLDIFPSYGNSSEGGGGYLEETLESSGMSDGHGMVMGAKGGDEDTEGEDDDSIEVEEDSEMAPKTEKRKWIDPEKVLVVDVKDSKVFGKRVVMMKRSQQLHMQGSQLLLNRLCERRQGLELTALLKLLHARRKPRRRPSS